MNSSAPDHSAAFPNDEDTVMHDVSRKLEYDMMMADCNAAVSSECGVHAGAKRLASLRSPDKAPPGASQRQRMMGPARLQIGATASRSSNGPELNGCMRSPPPVVVSRRCVKVVSPIPGMDFAAMAGAAATNSQLGGVQASKAVPGRVRHNFTVDHYTACEQYLLKCKEDAINPDDKELSRLSGDRGVDNAGKCIKVRPGLHKMYLDAKEAAAAKKHSKDRQLVVTDKALLFSFDVTHTVDKNVPEYVNAFKCSCGGPLTTAASSGSAHETQNYAVACTICTVKYRLIDLQVAVAKVRGSVPFKRLRELHALALQGQLHNAML